ncbi:MAG: hypothetical protein HY060_22755 [Proteobacteria bacterium]|nr:hypothetical protein [Pseudomonadota bacterium]
MDDAERNETPDLAILLDAMAAVVGEVSKVYQAVKRAVDSGDATDYRRALGAFDGLPAWQKERILRVAMARAEEVAKPEEEPPEELPQDQGLDPLPDVAREPEADAAPAPRAQLD